MYRSPGNALIRVTVFPILLLFWQYYFGTDIPLLGPALCAVFLCTSLEPPPLIMVLLMSGVLFATAWTQAVISNILYDVPIVYYIAIFVVFYWCMVRIKENPQDLIATLLIVSTSMVAVFSRQKGIDVSDIPWALLKNILIAGFTAYLGYLLVPGGSAIAPPSETVDRQATHTRVWHLLLKALVVTLTLIISINLNLAQSTIITVVVALVIKDPDPSIGHNYGVRRLLVTYAGFLYALPILAVNLLHTNLFGQLAVTVIFSLLMGIDAVSKKVSYNSLQLLFSGFVVLIFYGLTQSSDNAFMQDMVRFFSILAAVFIGTLALIILEPSSKSKTE
ncbi:TPA: DUF2955 domain-containing protein [Photobacterium damselae]